MTCKKGSGGTRKCKAGGREFTLHDRKRKGRSTRGISKYKFTKADAKACRQSDRKARGRCMAKRANARVG